MPKQPSMRLTSDAARIDSAKLVQFTFDGKSYLGHAGDTLASALIANGVHLVGRSFKYHRPRGIIAAGSEEPNALVRVGTGGEVEPNLRATQVEIFDGLVAESQNRFPSLKVDFGAINSLLGRFFPAGFYYKTFMWPASFWMTYEHIIRKAAGLGRVADDHNDPARYEHMNAHCELLIVGGGLTGLMAAKTAANSGVRVMLVDEQNEMGGWLLSRPDLKIDGMPAMEWVAQTRAALAANDRVTLMTRTTVFGYMDHNFITMAERVSDHMADKPAHLPRQRVWKVRAEKVILATGAIERPLVFGGNDLPGVMLASAAQSYVARYASLPGNRAVVMTNNDDAYRSALTLHEAGCYVRAIVDVRSNPGGALVEAARDAGITVLAGHAVTGAYGTLRVGRVEVCAINAAGDGVIAEPDYMDCDLMVMSGGLSPVVHLHSQARGKLSWDEETLCFRPSATHEAEISVGSANGQFDMAKGLAEAVNASVQMLGEMGIEISAPALPSLSDAAQNWAPMAVWKVPTGKLPGQGPKAFVDYQNDVTASDIQLAVREGYHSVEHVKRYTTTGMATDQGKTSNINALGILSNQLDKEIPAVGTTTFRMPYTPTSIGAIAGRDIKGLFDPVRLTRMDSWHRQAGAKFEHVGQWMRAWYYPQEGEDFQSAVNREVKAVRTTAGLLDASTLGKIDVRGPDAAEFLNRIYTNAFGKLAIGKCRYGLMLKDDGMVMDDGVTTRLAEDHFHMTTTTGGAARVLDWLEEFSQTEWPELKVYFSSVTEQWSVASLNGPNARKIIQAVGTDIDLSDAAFPFMSMREGHVCGIPARVFRISFTGDLAYEINVPARYGLALWTALMEAGKEHGLTPYGTEAMHVLRAEKGFIIVGQETDGTVNPLDLGMDWIVSKKKPDFIGKRALERVSMADPNRKQLVGLRTLDPKRVIPEGAHAVLDPNQPAPMEMLGQVTSSYWSPNLGHSIAMALLKGGHAMKGQRVWLPMIDGSAPIEAEICDTVFFDAKGDRING